MKGGCHRNLTDRNNTEQPTGKGAITTKVDEDILESSVERIDTRKISYKKKKS